MKQLLLFQNKNRSLEPKFYYCVVTDCRACVHLKHRFSITCFMNGQISLDSQCWEVINESIKVREDLSSGLRSGDSNPPPPFHLSLFHFPPPRAPLSEQVWGRRHTLVIQSVTTLSGQLFLLLLMAFNTLKERKMAELLFFPSPSPELKVNWELPIGRGGMEWDGNGQKGEERKGKEKNALWTFLSTCSTAVCFSETLSARPRAISAPLEGQAATHVPSLCSSAFVSEHGN